MGCQPSKTKLLEQLKASEQNECLSQLKKQIKTIISTDNHKILSDKCLRAVNMAADIYVPLDNKYAIQVEPKSEEKWRKKLTEQLNEKGTISKICNIAVQLWSSVALVDYEDIADDENLTMNAKSKSLSIINRFAALNKEMATKIINQQDLVEVLANLLKDSAVETLEDKKDNSQDGLRVRCLSILYHLSNAENAKRRLCYLDFIAIVTKLLEDSLPPNEKLLCTIVLCLIFPEDKFEEYIKTRCDLLELCLKHLETGIKEGCSIVSILDMAKAFKRIVETGHFNEHLKTDRGFPTMVELSKSRNKDEQKEAVLTLGSLAYFEDLHDEMIKNGIWDRFQELSKEESTDDDIKDTCKISMWMRKTKVNSEVCVSHTKGHIMISYCQKNKAIVKRIATDIEKEGFKIWIDYKDMQGSTLDAMSKAVEMADVVLICYSSPYKDSINCKREAMYADKLKKPIKFLKLEMTYDGTGWLAMVLGDSLYVDFSGKYSYKVKLQELLKDLKPYLKLEKQSLTPNQTDVDSVIGHSTEDELVDYINETNETTTAETKQQGQIDSRIKDNSTARSEDVSRISKENSAVVQNMTESVKSKHLNDDSLENPNTDIRSWTIEQAQSWLTRYDLKVKEKDFEKFTGLEIAFLKSLYDKHPEVFIKSMNKFLSIKDLSALARFKFALDDVTA